MPEYEGVYAEDQEGNDCKERNVLDPGPLEHLGHGGRVAQLLDGDVLDQGDVGVVEAVGGVDGTHPTYTRARGLAILEGGGKRQRHCMRANR